MSKLLQRKKNLYPPNNFILWAIVLFIAFIAFGLLFKAGAVIKLIYPVLALGVGALLYWKNPPFYLGFIWWIWFLTPFIRRVVDYQIGWTPMNPIVLTPYLVTLLAFFTFLHNLQLFFRHGFLPFVMILGAILYSYFIGGIKNSFFSASHNLLVWIVPVFFSIHIVLNWQDYPYYRKTVQRVFVWGAIFMGLYGIIQFISPSAWDRHWMLSAPMGSIGFPEPFRMRIFSSLNSPGPFAVVMMAGLLLLFGSKGLLRILAGVVGCVSFLLSLVRSAWGGWVVGILFIALKASGRLRFRLLVLSIVIGLGVLPLVSFGPIAERINERFQSFDEIEDDTSFRARMEFHASLIDEAFLNFVGQGLGSTGVSTKLSSDRFDEAGDVVVFDSGIMNIPFVLGWPGAFLYCWGVIRLILYIFSKTKGQGMFEITNHAIIVSMLTLLVFANSLIGLSGMVFWTFLGLGLAACKYNASLIKY